MDLKENERIDYIFDQKMPIIQSEEVFSFSLDAVILAYYTRISSRAKVVVDLCAGNGAVATFLTRKTKAKIYEIEIQEQLAEMAQRTAILNQAEDQINILNIDLKDSLKYLKHDSVDVICCNPPYFKVTPSSQQNPNQTLAIARHEIKTNLDEIVHVSMQLLKSGGRAFFIHRPERLTDILAVFDQYNLGINRLKFIHSFKDANSKMVFIEAIKGKSSEGIKVEPPLYIFEKEDVYTNEMSQIIHG
ncbi:tRNA1(Val) (adenine(37)-N6)-methyltransferase [Xylocopilactobacillus apis]|uniref:Methyltransferase n=1 Tax=Xylocopilactobacillus apis TaxID=2932183 RepID=A0AAU9D2H3_9LACO|nr:tRNA1(Val) (adenine(37)-N6)-methyltransferase [Xylocopilactobacillus apis]BDR56495.1 methyltransferase [Xylocopilactobacillus apis]